MAPIIFITGISGYIGGQVLKDITAKHPEYQVRGLVRNEEQQQKIAKNYPLVPTIIGDLDSTEVLTAEASQADVVLQLADADHNTCIPSLIQGLSQNSKKGTLIQLSGAANSLDASNGLGKPSTKIWDDVADLDEILTFDSTHIHAITDQLVVSEGKKHGVRTAVVQPPIVYGTGEGPVKKTSMLPYTVDAIKKHGKAFTIGEGKHITSVVYIKDLSAALLLLVEQALQPNGGKADWGDNGMYYIVGGSCVFVDLVNAIAKDMFERKMIASTELEELPLEEAKVLNPWAELLWGMNMRVRGSRILRLGLGWKPSQEDVFRSIPGLLG